MKKNTTPPNSAHPDRSWRHRHSQLSNLSHLDTTADLSVAQQPDPDSLVSWIDGLKSRVDSTLEQQEKELQKLRISARENRLKEHYRHQISSEAFDKLGEVLSENTHREYAGARDSPYPEERVSEEEEELSPEEEEEDDEEEEVSEDDIVEILSSEEEVDEEPGEEEDVQEEDNEEIVAEAYSDEALRREEEAIAREFNDELSRYVEEAAENMEEHPLAHAEYSYDEQEEEEGSPDQFDATEQESDGAADEIHEEESTNYFSTPAYQVRNGRPRLSDMPVASHQGNYGRDEASLSEEEASDQESLEEEESEQDESDHDEDEQAGHDNIDQALAHQEQAGPDEDDAIIILSSENEEDAGEENQSSEAESESVQHQEPTRSQYTEYPHDHMAEDSDQYSEAEELDQATSGGESEEDVEEDVNEDMEDREEVQPRTETTNLESEEEQEDESTNYFATANDSLEQDNLFASIASKALTDHILEDQRAQLDRVLSDYLADVESDAGPYRAPSQTNVEVIPVYRENKATSTSSQTFDLGTSSASKQNLEDASEGSLADSDTSDQVEDPHDSAEETAMTVPVFKTIKPESPRTTLRHLKETERKFGVKLHAVKELKLELGLPSSESSESESDTFVDAFAYQSEDDRVNQINPRDSVSGQLNQEEGTINSLGGEGSADKTSDADRIEDPLNEVKKSGSPLRPKVTVYTSGNHDSDSVSDKDISDSFYETSNAPGPTSSQQQPQEHEISSKATGFGQTHSSDIRPTKVSSTDASIQASSHETIPVGSATAPFEIIKQAQKDPRHTIPISIDHDGEKYELASCSAPGKYNVTLGEVASLNNHDSSMHSSASYRARASSPHDSVASTIASAHYTSGGSDGQGSANASVKVDNEQGKSSASQGKDHDIELSTEASVAGNDSTAHAYAKTDTSSGGEGYANASVQINAKTSSESEIRVHADSFSAHGSANATAALTTSSSGLEYAASAESVASGAEDERTDSSVQEANSSDMKSEGQAVLSNAVLDDHVTLHDNNEGEGEHAHTSDENQLSSEDEQLGIEDASSEQASILKPTRILETLSNLVGKVFRAPEELEDDNMDEDAVEETVERSQSTEHAQDEDFTSDDDSSLEEEGPATSEGDSMEVDSVSEEGESEILVDEDTESEGDEENAEAVLQEANSDEGQTIEDGDEQTLFVTEPDLAEPAYVVYESNTIVEGVEAVLPTEVEEPELDTHVGDQETEVSSAVEEIVTEIFSQLEEEVGAPTEVIEPEDELEEIVEVFEETAEVIEPTTIDELESMRNTPEPVESTVSAEDLDEPRGRKRHAGEGSIFSSPAKKLRSVASSFIPFRWLSSAQSSQSGEREPDIPVPELEDIAYGSSDGEYVEGSSSDASDDSSEDLSEVELIESDEGDLPASMSDVEEGGAENELDSGALSTFLETMEAVSNDSREPFSESEEDEVVATDGSAISTEPSNLVAESGTTDVAADDSLHGIESIKEKAEEINLQEGEVAGEKHEVEDVIDPEIHGSDAEQPHLPADPKEAEHNEEVEANDEEHVSQEKQANEDSGDSHGHIQPNESEEVAHAEDLKIDGADNGKHEVSKEVEELEEDAKHAVQKGEQDGAEAKIQKAFEANLEESAAKTSDDVGSDDETAHRSDEEIVSKTDTLENDAAELSRTDEIEGVNRVDIKGEASEPNAKLHEIIAPDLEAMTEIDDESVPALPQFRLVAPTLERLAAENKKLPKPQAVIPEPPTEAALQEQANDESVAKIFKLLEEKARERIEARPQTSEEAKPVDTKPAQEESTDQPVPKKRGRGRPRKHPIEHDQPPVAKRKPGRPPKAKKVENVMRSPERVTRSQGKVPEVASGSTLQEPDSEAKKTTIESEQSPASPGPIRTPRQTRRSGGVAETGHEKPLLSRTIDELQAVASDLGVAIDNGDDDGTPASRLRSRRRNTDVEEKDEHSASKSAHPAVNVAAEVNAEGLVESSLKKENEAPDVQKEEGHHDEEATRRSTRARRSRKHFDEEEIKKEDEVPSSPVVKAETGENLLSPAFSPQATLTSPRKRGRPRKVLGAQSSPTAEFSPPLPKSRTPSGSKWQLDSLDHPALRTRSKSPIKRSIQELSSDMEEDLPKRRRHNLKKVVDNIGEEEKRQEEEGRGRRRTRRS